MRYKLLTIFIVFLSLLFFSEKAWTQNNEPPVVEATGDQIYCPLESIKIATSVSITDTDNTGTESMFIQISSGYQFGQETLTLTGSHPNITTVWNPTTAKLELNSISGGEVVYTEFIAAILDVEFTTTNPSASGVREFSITWGDANYLPSTGHFYEYIADPGITWTAARTAAAGRTYFGLQGYLATLTSAAEAQLSGEQADGTGWIGGSDSQVEGTWRWMTGPEAGGSFWIGQANGSTAGTDYPYAFWNNSEPNNLGNEDYAHITAPGVGIPGSWNDLANTGDPNPGSAYHPQGYIVEYGGMPGDPEINISASTMITIPEIVTTSSAIICGSGSVVLEATSNLGVVNWYDSVTSTTPFFTGNSYTTPVLNSTTPYYVAAAVDASCVTGTKVLITATVNPIPVITSTTGDTVCFNGTGTLQATATPGSEINWYDVPNGGTSLGTGNTFITPAVSNTTPYYTDATLNGCTTLTRTLVEVTVYAPIAPTGDAIQTFCDIENAAISDLTTTSGTNILWYDAPSGGNVYTGTEALVNGQFYYASQNDGICESIDRLEVEVVIYETVIPTPITPLEECDDTISGSDTDGITEFDLTEKETELLNGQDPLLFNFSYFTDSSFTDLINNPTAYTNTTPGGQPIYVRIENINDINCLTQTEFELVVHELPTTSPPSIYSQCDDATNDGLALFNLTQESIKAEISSDYISENLVFSYFNTQVDAQDGTDSILNPDSYQNSVPYVIETVWIRIENPNTCFRIESIDLQVTPSQDAILDYDPNPLYQCDDGVDNRDGIATFDMTAIHDEISNDVFPTITVSVHFYENLVDAELENNEIMDIANHQNTNSPNVQDIWVRVKSDLGNNCLGLKEFPALLNVEALPFANPVTTAMKECDDNNDGVFLFDTSTVESEILGSQNLTEVSVSYFDANGNQLTDFNGNPISSPFPSTFLSTSQVISYTVTNNNTNDPDGACFDTNTLEFIVDELPINNDVIISPECDEDPNDALVFATFDTSTLESDIGAQSGMEITYSDASGNPLTDIYGTVITSPFPNTFSTSSQVITTTVTNPANVACQVSNTIEFLVFELPQFELADEDLVCENSLPHAISVENPDRNDYLYEWFDPNGTLVGTEQTLWITSTDAISVSGVNYTVVVSNPITNCQSSDTILLRKSSIATITLNDIITVEFSSPNNSIEIITDNLGSGDYEFALDHEYDSKFYQDEPLFTGLEGGIYTVRVNDKNNCGEASIEVVLLDYLPFFTPNGDGINDVWELIGIESKSYTVSPVQIFDRYGKLIVVLNPYQEGWDGLYDGEPLPSSDYWFSLELTDSDGNITLHRGHFSMIRR